MGAFRPRVVLEKAYWTGTLILAAAVTLLPCVAGAQNGLPYPPKEPGLPPMNQMANPTADANRLMLDSMKQQDNQKQFELMNVQRRKEMTSDAAKMIALAYELNAKADKVTPDKLSMFEIQQAEQIGKLARQIQDKMRASLAGKCLAYLGTPPAGCQ